LTQGRSCALRDSIVTMKTPTLGSLCIDMYEIM
jgi:hypothetical protein